jgi:hypothetical protein
MSTVDFTSLSVRSLLGMSDATLGAVDPVVLNLTVAKEIPSLDGLDVPYFVSLADEWANDLRRQGLAWPHFDIWTAILDPKPPTPGLDIGDAPLTDEELNKQLLQDPVIGASFEDQLNEDALGDRVFNF